MNITASVFRIRVALTETLTSVRNSGPGFSETLRCWSYRIRPRRHLSTMDSHLLADIGLTTEDAITESRQPFWRPVSPSRSGLGLRR